MGNVQWWINLYARTRTWIVAEDEDGVEFCLGHVRQFHGTDSTAVPADVRRRQRRPCGHGRAGRRAARGG